VLAELTASLDLTVTPCTSTLKRICKRAGLNWKRVRKSLRSKRDPDLFEQSRQQLAMLIEQAHQKEIDLFYFDESGFTLEPCVPYAWQPRGETIEVPCAKSKRLNVLGFVNRECSFTSVVFEGSITSAVVVASIDHFIPSLQRQTVLVMDNASIIVNIAPYSPELNIIEIVWRKIKYEWMPFSAYESFRNLKESLFDILANIGKSYTVNFA
jgi:hypothetical protein